MGKIKKDELKLLRAKIDKLDEAIIKKLALRQKLSKKIGLLKTDAGKPIRDYKREAAQQRKYKKIATHSQIDALFISKLFEIIIANSRSVQKS